MRSTEISPSGSESISSRIFWAAVSVTVTIRVSVYQRVSAGKGPRLCDSCSTRNFSIRSRVRDTARKTPPRLVWRRDARRPGRLVSVPRLRLLRPCDPGAVILEQVRWFAVAEFGFFIAILAVAYVYVWKKGALEWRR